MVQSGESTLLDAAAAVNGSPAVDSAVALPPHDSDTFVYSGPRIPKRLEWVDLPAEYEGFRARVWINYPQRLVADIQSGDQDRMAAALAQVVVEHNGWLNDQGEPFPPSTSAAFWQEIPNELAALLITLVGLEASKLPNSLLPKRSR